MPPVSRRALLATGLAGAGAAALGLLAWTGHSRRIGGPLPSASDRLTEAADGSTGLPLLRLPEGFRYRTLSWADSRLHDGHPVPRSADGMGAVAQHGSRITLVRNHELRGSSGPIGDPANAYDTTGGGTTTLVFDSASESLADSWISLGGTLNNCAGGVTPWGTWLSCEEAVLSPGRHALPWSGRQLYWHIGNARREHGFVFEVPGTGIARPEPIRPMGQFYHEAVAIDPREGIAYLTEDNWPRAGFYRYVPDRPGILSAGGRLQMLRAGAGRDMRSGLAMGDRFDVEWVDIEWPEHGFSDGTPAGDGVLTQGLSAGASSFIALEGCTCHGERVIFTSKQGGTRKAGQVFEFDSRQQTVALIYESPGHQTISGPDNIVMTPGGNVLICEDRLIAGAAGQSLALLRPDGSLERFCQVNSDLRGRYAGHDLRATIRSSEWAGVTFSPDGNWLFCNLYNPGVTVAITGPWEMIDTHGFDRRPAAPAMARPSSGAVPFS